MAGDMQTDTKSKIIPGFSPTRIQAVTTAAWTPLADDRVFMLSEECTVQFNSAGEVGTLPAGMPIVLIKGYTYTFSVGQNIWVM